MTEMVQHPFTVTMVTPRQACASSWWIGATPDGIAAEQQMTA